MPGSAGRRDYRFMVKFLVIHAIEQGTPQNRRDDANDDLGSEFGVFTCHTRSAVASAALVVFLPLVFVSAQDFLLFLLLLLFDLLFLEGRIYIPLLTDVFFI